MMQLYFNRRALITALICLIGTLIFPLKLWIFAFLFHTVFLAPVLITTFHEFVSHEVVRPRNSFIEFVLLTVFIVYTGDNLRNKKNYHYLHHRYSGDSEKDPTQVKVDKLSALQYIFDIGPQTHIDIPKEVTPEFTSPIWMFFDKHHKIIFICSLVLWVIFFPLWTIMAFYFYPRFFLNLSSKFVDLHFHKYHGTDIKILVPIIGTAALHHTHHTVWRDDFYGDDYWKYINFQFWYSKLLFKKV
jgi:hypothetical protein